MARYSRIKEVAAYTQLKERTIRSYVLKKTIPHLKVNGCVVFDLEAIDEWMLQHNRPMNSSSHKGESL